MTAVQTDPRAVAETVTDPELPMLTLADLGVLRDVRDEDGTVVVEITPTYSGCPAMGVMRADLVHALHRAGAHDRAGAAVPGPHPADRRLPAVRLPGHRGGQRVQHHQLRLTSLAIIHPIGSLNEPSSPAAE